MVWRTILHDCMYETHLVNRTNSLWKAANIKDRNKGAAVYAESSLTVHNPSIFVEKLWRNKLLCDVFWSVRLKYRNAIEDCTPSCPQNHITKDLTGLITFPLELPKWAVKCRNEFSPKLVSFRCCKPQILTDKPSLTILNSLLDCLYYHSLCWWSFCASAGRKPCT